MTRSMTAYGRAETESGGKRITAELKSVNSRYFDCTVKIPRLYGFLEERVKSYLQSHGISRGKVDVYIGVELIESSGTEVALDEVYLKSYLGALHRLRDSYGLADDISVMTVAKNSDIFSVRSAEEDPEQDWNAVQTALDAALDGFCAMREREGENLRRDIIAKRDKLRLLRADVAARSEESVAGYRSRLEGKLRAVLGELNMEFDSQRILTECAIYADRISIDEELVRLESHFGAVDAIINSPEPSGRKLDFLVQEMNREVNTIGSKCSDAGIAAVVVEMKSEIEKIREQIQNIE